MATGKQKVVNKEKEIEKRLAAIEAAREMRQKLDKAHGDFRGINNLIREVREGKSAYHE